MGGGGPVGPEAWQKCNINEVTDLNQYDPISGFPVYKALLCDVTRVSKGEGTLRVGSGEYTNIMKSPEHSKKASPKRGVLVDVSQRH